MAKIFNERDAIYNLQTYLRAQRFLNEKAPTVPVDGIFDSATRTALIEFQRKKGLNTTGIADKTTWELLYGDYLVALEEQALPAPIIPFPSTPTNHSYKLGDEGFIVSTIQFILNELGVIYDTFDDVKITGIYDNPTRDAVRDFQERNSLDPTGEVDKRTWGALARIYNLLAHFIEQK